jgi:hypothetical protein
LEKKRSILPYYIAIVSFAIPYFISNGLNNFSGEKLIFAELALDESELFWENPIEKMFIFKKKVLSVERIYGKCQHFGIENAYVAIIQSYTFFGIPLSKIKIDCSHVEMFS